MRVRATILIFCAIWWIPCGAISDCNPSKFGSWAEQPVRREGGFIKAVGVSDDWANVSEARLEALKKAEAEIRTYLNLDEEEILEPETLRTIDCSPSPNRFISIRLISLDIEKKRKRKEREPASLPTPPTTISSSEEKKNHHRAGIITWEGVDYPFPNPDVTGGLIMKLGYESDLSSWMDWRITADLIYDVNKKVEAKKYLVGHDDGTSLGGGLSLGAHVPIFGPLFIRPEVSLYKQSLYRPHSEVAEPFLIGVWGAVIGVSVVVYEEEKKEGKIEGKIEFGIPVKRRLSISPSGTSLVPSTSILFGLTVVKN